MVCAPPLNLIANTNFRKERRVVQNESLAYMIEKCTNFPLSHDAESNRTYFAEQFLPGTCVKVQMEASRPGSTKSVLRWFSGKIAHVSASSNLHTIQYDDGDEFQHDLWKLNSKDDIAHTVTAWRVSGD